MARTYSVKLNSVEKIEQLLQEIYEQSCKNIIEIQNEMNKLANSCTELKDATIDEKAKYSKAMHDLIGDKDKALSRKLEIAKFMGEIVKHNGDVSKTLEDPNTSKMTKLNLNDIRKTIGSLNNTENKPDIIDLKRP